MVKMFIRIYSSGGKYNYKKNVDSKLYERHNLYGPAVSNGLFNEKDYYINGFKIEKDILHK